MGVLYYVELGLAVLVLLFSLSLGCWLTRYYATHEEDDQ